MRLINTCTLELEEFFYSDIPEYAILSHTWGPDEITLQDFSSTWLPLLPWRKSRGYSKVVNACQAAIDGGYDYLWCDTCCIDKTSSAESSEAINSMFRWYKNAVRCLVYLEDFSHDPDKPIDIGHCRWLTRGWCLQELIAPYHITFFDKDWKDFATKEDLIEQLVLHTRIDRVVLNGSVCLPELPVARRLSWATRRTTSRIEDEAYSLLGILGVNMPLIYGEGSGAFRRLQQEVLRVHDDASIFIWHADEDEDYSVESIAAMLAPRVSCFLTSGNVGFASDFLASKNSPSFSCTSRGVYTRGASLNLDSDPAVSSLGSYMFPLWDLTQWRSGDNGGHVSDGTKCLCLCLLKIGTSTYGRVPGWAACYTNAQAGVMDLVIPEEDFHIVDGVAFHLSRYFRTSLRGFVRFEFVDGLHNIGLSVEPRASWDSFHSRFFVEGPIKFAGCIKVHIVISSPRGPLPESFLIGFTTPSTTGLSPSGVDLGLSAYLIPSHVWDFYADIGHNLERRINAAIKHLAITKITSPCQDMCITSGSLQLKIGVSRQDIVSSDDSEETIQEVISLSWTNRTPHESSEDQTHERD